MKYYSLIILILFASYGFASMVGVVDKTEIQKTTIVKVDE